MIIFYVICWIIIAIGSGFIAVLNFMEGSIFQGLIYCFIVGMITAMLERIYKEWKR